MKHSSLVFSLLTLVGAALMMFSPIFIVLESPQCMPWLWFFGVGFVLFFGYARIMQLSPSVTNLCYSSMAVKCYRIDRIFNWHRKKLTKIKPIGDSQLMVIVSILLGLEVVSHVTVHATRMSNGNRYCSSYGTLLVVFALFNLRAQPIPFSAATRTMHSHSSSLKLSTLASCFWSAVSLRSERETLTLARTKRPRRSFFRYVLDIKMHGPILTVLL